MIFRQYEAIIRKQKTETRRTSEKDTYQVGHIYSVVPKRAKPTVWYRWLTDGKLDIWHESYSPSTPQPLPFDRVNWIPLKIRIISKHWELLQDITEEGAIAEGIEYLPDFDVYRHEFSEEVLATAVDAYHNLWDSINGKSKEYCWSANPLVCVHKFALVGVT